MASKAPPPTVPLSLRATAWYRLMSKEPATEEYGRGEWHLLAETAHLVELAEQDGNVRTYAEIRARLRSLGLIETGRRRPEKPSAAAVSSFNALRSRGPNRMRDPRNARTA